MPKEGKSSSRQDVGGQVLSHAQGSALGCPACPGAGNLHLCNIRRSREAFLWSSATQQPDDAGLKKPWGPSGQIDRGVEGPTSSPPLVMLGLGLATVTLTLAAIVLGLTGRRRAASHPVCPVSASQ